MDGFSNSQSKEGSALIFSTSRVARYAAKPVNDGLAVELGCNPSRASDLIPRGWVQSIRISRGCLRKWCTPLSMPRPQNGNLNTISSNN